MPSPYKTVVGYVAGTIAAVSIGVGVWQAAAQTPSGTAVANTWITATSPGTCTRSFTQVDYATASGANGGPNTTCSGMTVPLNQCVPGDLLRMRAGTYASQTITRNVTSSNPDQKCTIIAGDGGTTTIGGLSMNGGDNIEIDNITSTGQWSIWGASGAGPATGPGYPTNVTCRNCHFDGITGTALFWRQCQSCSFIGGSVSHTRIEADGHEPIYLQDGTNGHQSSNLLIQGVTFDDNIRTNSTAHVEQIRIESLSWSNLKIIGNTFCCNNFSNTATIFITASSSCTSTCGSNYIIENNYFGSDNNASIHTQDPNVGNCNGIKVRYNTFQNTATTMACPQISGGSIIQGNIGTPGSACDSASLYAHNVWLNKTCSGTDISTANLQYTGGEGGFAIGPSSPAATHGDPAYCPVDDHVGTTRPQPAATTCDAGAFEVG